jgi:ABC-type amino acid transport substrate-binding protein
MRIPNLLTLIVLLTVVAPARAADDAPLRVVLRVAPPFVIDEGDGEMSGISVDLWRSVAEDLQLTYEVEVAGLEEMLEAIARGEADVGVGATTINADRETRLDFLHPFMSSGLAIAAPSTGSAWTAVLKNLLSAEFLRAVSALAVLLITVGLVIWLAERRANQEEFQPNASRGLWSGFWFAAVTMTTVGYGDKAPRSILGRVVALVWMFASIIVISFFTASIATSLTVQTLAQGIDGPEDLPGLRVGALEGATGAAYLDARDVNTVRYETAREAVRALAHGEVDAVVHDAPILQWEIREAGYGDLKVLPERIERQDYAFIVPTGSELRESVNRALLARMASPAFDRMLQAYLGR